MEWLQDFHFLRPYWLLALVFPLFFSWKVWHNDAVQSSWAKVCDEHLLNFLLLKSHDKQRKFPYILAALILFFTVLSLSGPTWVKKQNPALSVDNPVMIMINMSTDMWDNDVSPSRIVRAEYIVRDLLQSFQSTESGLLVYSREPFVISPLTEDVSLIENLLSQLDSDIMPENGDRLDRAIDLAVERMLGAGYENGNLIVLAADAGERLDAALESAAKAAASGFDVNIIKVSTDKNEKLAMIADKGNGLYLDYQQNLTPFINKINNIYQKELKQSENMQTMWEDMGYYLFWLPAFLLLYYFRKGILIGCLLLFFAAKSAYAGWFLNNNQEALRSFEQEDYQQAAQKFDNPAWKAAALYKSGDFSKAYEYYLNQNDNTSLYNQGNALAKSGKIAEAIEKYEEVLRQDEDFADARFNLEYLKKMQQQQQQQQQQQDNRQNQSDEDNSENDKQPSSNDEQQEEQQSESQDKNNQNQQDNQENSSNNLNNQPQNGEDNQSPEQSSSSSNGEQKAPKHDDGNGNDENNQQMNNQQNQNQADDHPDDNANNEAEAQKQAMTGSEDENSSQMAKSLPTEAGDKSDEEQQKARARMQKFRDIPEDKGGLLRALINREYQLRRYEN